MYKQIEENVVMLINMETIVNELINEGFTHIQLVRNGNDVSEDLPANRYDLANKLTSYDLISEKGEMNQADPREFERMEGNTGRLNFIDFYGPNQIGVIFKTLASKSTMHSRELLCKQCTANTYAIFAKK